MKVEIARDEFLKALTRVVRVVEKRQTIPVLGNVWLKGEGSTLSLRATDLDIEASDTINATVDVEGAVTVPAYMLFDIVRTLSTGAMMSMELVGTLMNFACGKGRFKLPTLPANDLPPLPFGDTKVKFDIPQGVLRAMVGRVKFAMSDEETRYFLNGIYVHHHEGALRLVATDGHRLAKTEVPSPDGADGMRPVILPRKTVDELTKILDTSDIPITVEFSEYKARFTTGNYTLTSKLIDGTYPDYDKFIPYGNSKEMHTSLEHLTAAVIRVAAVQERGRPVTIMMEADALRLSVDNKDAGSSHDEIECDYQSDPLKIGFNSRYLIDVLQNIGDEDVVGLFNEPGSPGLFYPKSDPKSIYIVMPMAVR